MFWGIARILIATATLLWQLYWLPRAIRLHQGLSRSGSVLLIIGTAIWTSAAIYQGAEDINTSLLHYTIIHEVASVLVAFGICVVSFGILLIARSGKRERSQLTGENR